VCLLAGMGVFFFVIRPVAETVGGLQTDSEDLAKKIKETGLPADAEKLESLLREYQRTIEGVKGRDEKAGGGILGLRDRANTVLENATSMFKTKIENDYISVGDFMNQAQQLDYQAEYNQLESWLRNEGIILAENVFGMSEDTTDLENTYQLLLKLWTVDALVKMALKHQLSVAKDMRTTVGTARGPNVRPSLITVLPLQSYILNDDDKEPYLLEFPVRMTMRGSIEQICLFIRNLHADGNFFPISHLEMKTQNPKIGGAPKDGVISVETIDVTVVCSSFFRPQGEAPKLKLDKTVKPPKGA
jgi:hypothetical protein